MSIVQGTCHSFFQELGQAIHDFDNDTLKIALYSADADMNPWTTTAYSATNEVSASGYTAGGASLTSVTWSLYSSYGKGVAYLDAADVAFGVSITARGALVYNSSKANRAIAILDFGASLAKTTFSVVMPDATFEKALIRIGVAGA